MSAKKTAKSSKVQKSTTKSKFDHSSIVAERVELRSVQLSNMSADVGDLTKGLPRNATCETTVIARVDKKNNKLVLFPCLEFCARHDKEKNPAVSISATYQLTYELSSFEGIEAEEIAAFAEINGVYNAWPYFREFLQSTLMRLNLPAFTLPVYRPCRDGVVDVKNVDVKDC